MAKPSIPTNPDGETMKAVCFTAFGKDSSALSVKTIPKPTCGDDGDEVLIKVHAASLNPIDKIRLAGDLALVRPEMYDTSVLGYDVSGVVEKVGKEASASFTVGDEVFVRLSGMKFGALAEYVVCTVPELAKKPSNVSFAEAAAVPLAGLMALQSFRRGGVKEGSKVFIPAGSGGVGSIAIQIAKKIFKASHICTTASPGAGTEICQKAGADRVINYREEDIEQVLKGEDFDMILDTTNESTKFGGLIKKGGKVITISGTPTVESMSQVAELSLLVKFFLFLSRNRAAEKAIGKAGGSWEHLFMSPNGKDLAEIATFLESGEIKPFIDTEGPSLDDFKVVVDKLFSGRSKGKCVIKVV